VASLAPAVIASAEAGDHVAQQILEAGVDELVCTVRAAAAQLGVTDAVASFPLVLSGALPLIVMPPQLAPARAPTCHCSCALSSCACAEHELGCCAGGLLANENRYADMVSAALRAEFAFMDVRAPEVSAAMGAACLGAHYARTGPREGLSDDHPSILRGVLGTCADEAGSLELIAVSGSPLLHVSSGALARP